MPVKSNVLSHWWRILKSISLLYPHKRGRLLGVPALRQLQSLHCQITHAKNQSRFNAIQIGKSSSAFYKEVKVLDDFPAVIHLHEVLWSDFDYVVMRVRYNTLERKAVIRDVICLISSANDRALTESWRTWRQQFINSRRIGYDRRGINLCCREDGVNQQRIGSDFFMFREGFQQRLAHFHLCIRDKQIE